MKAAFTTVLATKRLTLAVLLVLSSTLVGIAGTAHAEEPSDVGNQSGRRFGIRPAQAAANDATSFSYFTHRLEPGDRLVDMALVIYEGESQVRLRVFVAAPLLRLTAELRSVSRTAALAAWPTGYRSTWKKCCLNLAQPRSSGSPSQCQRMPGRAITSPGSSSSERWIAPGQTRITRMDNRSSRSMWCNESG